MVEKIYDAAAADEKTIEKLVDDNPVMMNHVVLAKGDTLPEHYSNSNVYLILVRGTMAARFNEQEPHEYKCGQIVQVPYNTKMNIGNRNSGALEFYIVKAPNPKNYREE
ncbi:MAG: cupin domain-containing protein [Christensenellales bacterium]